MTNILQKYLTNPGRFSILLLGKHGTGKQYGVQKVISENQDVDCLNELMVVNAARHPNEDIEYWKAIFDQANGAVLLIKNVEALSLSSQEILFEGLSTDDEGHFGFQKKNLAFRIVFTSTMNIKRLRDSEEKLSNRFFDRISQLVLEFPSYEKGDMRLWNDFKKTWAKMNFSAENIIPGNELKSWLERNGNILHGNFRDLDKIAINWHQYRLMNIPEANILKLVESSFKEYWHYPVHGAESGSSFNIAPETDWEQNLNAFKRHYKNWLKNTFGSYQKGAKHANISHRTLERW